ncbi:MAG: methyltransferase domain-containing protein [Vicinamibacteria bacterium]
MSRLARSARYLRLAARALVREVRTDAHAHEHPSYSEAELLARAEEFNRNAELHWRKIAAETAGRAHVLNKPFSTVRDTPDILYRLGLVLQALDLGVGHTVLDFGSGSCWLSSSINRLRCRTISMDVSPTALRLGEELFRSDARHHLELGPRFVPYDGHRIPLDDASLDRAICFDSFHHVPNQDEVLRELYRVLRPGGRLVMAEPGEGHSHADQSVFETEAHGVLENDLHLDELTEKALRTGFSAVQLKPYPDAGALTLSSEDYQRFVSGDESVFPLHVLQSSLRHFYLLIFLKGEPRVDSRNPRALLAEIEPLTPRLAARAADRASLRVRVRNTGDTLWLREKTPEGGYVMLGGHLTNEAGDSVARGFLRGALPRDVAPGESVELEADVPTPERPGRYRIALDMVDEFVAWFEQCGSKVVGVTLDVTGYRDSRDPHRLIATIERTGPWPEAPVRPGSSIETRFRLTNTGDTAWHAGAPGERGAVSLGAQLRDAGGRTLAQDHSRVALPQALAPGESIEVDARVPGPLGAGAHTLRFDLVAEQVCWFEQMGSAVLSLPVAGSDETPDSTAPGVLRASLERLDAGAAAPLAGAAGAEAALRLRVRNAGNTLWLHAPEKRHGHVALGAHLLDAAGALVEQDFLRCPLPRALEPGASAELSCRFRLPARAGRYRLLLDLVDEGVAWFASSGSPTLAVPLDVR